MFACLADSHSASCPPADCAVPSPARKVCAAPASALGHQSALLHPLSSSRLRPLASRPPPQSNQPLASCRAVAAFPHHCRLPPSTTPAHLIHPLPPQRLCAPRYLPPIAFVVVNTNTPDLPALTVPSYSIRQPTSQNPSRYARPPTLISCGHRARLNPLHDWFFSRPATCPFIAHGASEASPYPSPPSRLSRPLSRPQCFLDFSFGYAAGCVVEE